jgi:cytochrome d ubiquinol oxidase subunit II
LLTSPVPLLVAAVAVVFWRGLTPRHHITPFLCTQALFALCFAGLGISIFPLMVPPSITIWDAAAPASSQLFLLVGASVLIPVILCYTGFAYYVFRGKVKAGVHYH